jgi:hypothetical protein
MMDESGEGMDIIGDLRVDSTARMRTKFTQRVDICEGIRILYKILLSRAPTT